MALTWTKLVPDHYDSAAKSSPSLPGSTGGNPFAFRRLPIELRLQVYKAYLVDRYSSSPVAIHEMVLDPPESPVEILQVSKAVNTEVLDLLKHETSSDLRTCWQNPAFDGLAKSSFRAMDERLDYDHIPHLRIKIYPPHQDRPTDMICI